jgi:NAD(P)-dependent dehydrogenase (short-subunit alcohol dehydrogenase family)
MSIDAVKAGGTAVVTGGAQGIGLALARQLAQRGMSLVIADLAVEAFEDAIAVCKAAGAPEAVAMDVDVSDEQALRSLEAEVTLTFGGADVVVLNAGIQPGSDIFDTTHSWDRVLSVNLMGVIRGAQVFAPGMIDRGDPGLIVATGSKQGITTPPGDPAYNVAKAGVKVFTEALEYELRERTGGRVSARLLVPGFVFTGLTARGLTDRPAGAWTPEEMAEFAMTRLDAGDFYILCPDNEVDRSTDEKRMTWAIGDIVENRPPLSRWHPDWAEQFHDFLNAKG